MYDRSVETAVFKASPLPMPTDAALIDQFRELRYVFKPVGCFVSAARRIFLVVSLLAGLGAVTNARAALTIEITKGVESALPIAVEPFGVAEAAQVIFRVWRLVNVDSLVIGKVSPLGAGYVVQFQLFDVFRGVQLAGYSVRSDAGGLRHAAHQIADIIYETLTGEPGAFATRIAYVTVEQQAGGKQRYTLEVADADGFDPKVILQSPQPLLSPAGASDGNRLAYVSFENKRSQVWVQDLTSGKRDLITSFPGINGAPAWAPNGRELAVALSKDGNPDIYVLNLASKQLRRVTDNLAIDTEPVWSPDGQTIYFTSDRGGSPQIYRTSSSGGRAERVSFVGAYNARSSVSPVGKFIALVTGSSNRFQFGVLKHTNNTQQDSTEGRLDESPSFAPNGRMSIYATRDKGRGVLAAVSIDGRVQQRFSAREGDAREPVWSPLWFCVLFWFCFFFFFRVWCCFF